MFRAIVFFSLCVFGMSSAVGAEKVAVFNPDAAILASDYAKKRIQELKKKDPIKGQITQLEKMDKRQTELVAKLERDKAVMDQVTLQNLANQIQEIRVDMEHVAKKLRAHEQTALQTIGAEMAPKVQEVVNRLIKQEKIGLLLSPQGAMHISESFNLTPKVVAELNKLP